MKKSLKKTLSIKNIVFSITCGAIGTFIGTILYVKYGEFVANHFGWLEYILLMVVVIFILGVISLVRILILPRFYTLNDIVTISLLVDKLKENRDFKIDTKISLKEISSSAFTK